MSGVVRALAVALLWWVLASLFALAIWSGGLAMLGDSANMRIAIGLAAGLGGMTGAFAILHWVVKRMERR